MDIAPSVEAARKRAKEIFSAYLSGLSLEQCAKQFGMSRRSISEMMIDERNQAIYRAGLGVAVYASLNRKDLLSLFQKISTWEKRNGHDHCWPWPDPLIKEHSHGQ